MIEKTASDAPAWYSAEEAGAWANGYNAACDGLVTVEVPAEAEVSVWLRDAGDAEDACWVPCAKGDPGAVEFIKVAQ